MHSFPVVRAGEVVNRLEVIDAASKYVSQPHKILALDGVPLDVLLDTARPQDNLLGLVPTLIDCLDDLTERELVWQRILPPIGQPAIAPVLMCPDDLDLWCTVVVAEVVAEESVVLWRRIGLDVSKPEDMPRSVGTAVD